MTTAVTLDRYEEGSLQTLAILLTENDQILELPKSFLPPEAVPGDVLRLELTIDAEATVRLKEEVRRLLDELRKKDRGGDVTL